MTREEGNDHASRVIIRHAPITDQPTIQPTMTEIIALVLAARTPQPASTPPAAEPHRAEAQCAEHDKHEEDNPDVQLATRVGPAGQCVNCVHGR